MTVADALVAVYRRAWRDDCDDVELPASLLPRVTEILLATGGAAIGWRRLKRHHPTLLELRDAARLHALGARERVRRTVEVLAACADAGVRVLLLKGWALARHYPRLHLRPYGDIDLLLPPADRARAQRLIAALGARADVDLHTRIVGVDASFAALFDDGEPALLDGQPVRLLGPAAQTRFLCAHFAKHGGARPLWLVDLALLAERGWPFAAVDRPLLGAARALLGAAVSDDAPAWLVDDVRRAWARGRLQPTRAFTLHDPGYWPRGLVERWPSPLETCHLLQLGLAGDRAPRWPLSAVALGKKMAAFAGRHAPRDLRCVHRWPPRRASP